MLDLIDRALGSVLAFVLFDVIGLASLPSLDDE